MVEAKIKFSRRNSTRLESARPSAFLTFAIVRRENFGAPLPHAAYQRDIILCLSLYLSPSHFLLYSNYPIAESYLGVRGRVAYIHIYIDIFHSRCKFLDYFRAGLRFVDSARNRCPGACRRAGRRTGGRYPCREERGCLAMSPFSRPLAPRSFLFAVASFHRREILIV